MRCKQCNRTQAEIAQDADDDTASSTQWRSVGSRVPAPRNRLYACPVASCRTAGCLHCFLQEYSFKNQFGNNVMYEKVHSEKVCVLNTKSEGICGDHDETLYVAEMVSICYPVPWYQFWSYTAESWCVLIAVLLFFSSLCLEFFRWQSGNARAATCINAIPILAGVLFFLTSWLGPISKYGSSRKDDIRFILLATLFPYSFCVFELCRTGHWSPPEYVPWAFAARTLARFAFFYYSNTDIQPTSHQRAVDHLVTLGQESRAPET